MLLREALREGLNTLSQAGIPSPQLAAELLLMHTLGLTRGELHSHPERELLPEVTERYFQLIAERLTGKPTQYITGRQEFWGLDIEVTPDVLIPRPGTEHVVEAVLELAASARVQRAEGSGFIPVTRRPPHPQSFSPWSGGEGGLMPGEGRGPVRQTLPSSKRIVDVGTGSGCIALALASELPSAEIYAVDISLAALKVAMKNAQRLQLADRINFLQADLLSCFSRRAAIGSFDFIVSNPPYVAMDELDMVQREVKEFEPRLAWGSLENGDEIYRRLFPQAQQLLRPGGYVVVEIGYKMGGTVAGLLGMGWKNVEVRPDLSGVPRVVVGRKAV
ncbi:MAG TPA: HemK/PrmC family methyltransferase [Terriglobia bacterium]|nr:HemK/PrmC family methyltransferase [Terriglobia bacterium]